MTKPLICFLLIVLVLTSGFTYPTGICGQVKQAASCAMKKSMCMMENHPCKHRPYANNKKDKSGQNCAFCILCVAFIVPFKPAAQKYFATGKVDFPRPLQSELTYFNASPWRPPAA